METLTLTTAISRPLTQGYRVDRLDLNWAGGNSQLAYIHGELVDENGLRFEPADYKGDEAVFLMRALNTANLSIKSLHRRYLERLVADGRLSGSVDGTPD